MKSVELTNYEINDLIRTLEYAIKKKKEDYQLEKINIKQYQYEVGIIRDLIRTIPTKTRISKKVNKEDLIKII